MRERTYFYTFPGDQMLPPRDEEPVCDPKTFNEQERKLMEYLNQREKPNQAEVCFPKGTVIFPLWLPRRLRKAGITLQKELLAKRVRDKKGKPARSDNLSEWKAVTPSQAYRDGQSYPVNKGNQFLAYVSNAKKRKR